MQGGYDRAHATRYTVLYTSLAAPYSLQFEDPGSLALPFPRGNQPEEFFEHRKLTYRRGPVTGSNNGASLSDYYVDSNAIGMLHSEQMIELGGSLIGRQTGDGGFEVVNGTTYTLLDARVIRKDNAGKVEALWLGAIEPNQRKRPDPSHAVAGLELSESDLSALAEQAAGQKPSESDLSTLAKLAHLELSESDLSTLAKLAGLESSELDLSTLVLQALDPELLRPGDVRLIACLKEELPGLTIEPSANQPRCATLVVAHLNYDPGPAPKPDANLRKERSRPRTPGFDEPPLE